jgi:Zn-dependent peptidase ImmA (M78 family)
LNHAGFKEKFIRTAVLPDWWEDSCVHQSELLSDVEIRIARFLGIPLSSVKNPATDLTLPKYTNAHFRRVMTANKDRLSPAIHSALRIGAAVIRSLRTSPSVLKHLPKDASTWREEILEGKGPVTLDKLLKNLWERGIPVVPIDVLPSPNFQGIACVVEDRPVILLGHRHDEPGRVAFIIAHEVGHIADGDCAPGQPVVDEEGSVKDDADMERGAELYARSVLIGTGEVPAIDTTDFMQMAKTAAQYEQRSGVDASLIIFNWATETFDYTTASMAVKALYMDKGARNQLRLYFDQYVDIDKATETDRALLRCVYRDPGIDETPS